MWTREKNKPRNFNMKQEKGDNINSAMALLKGR